MKHFLIFELDLFGCVGKPTLSWKPWSKGINRFFYSILYYKFSWNFHCSSLSCNCNFVCVSIIFSVLVLLLPLCFPFVNASILGVVVLRSFTSCSYEFFSLHFAYDYVKFHNFIHSSHLQFRRYFHNHNMY